MLHNSPGLKENGRMAKSKYDGVIEVVRYAPEGQIQLVRAYERRGATFSDRLLWSRSELVDRLKSGQKIVIGSRIPVLASTFNVSASVRLERSRSGEVVTSGSGPADSDRLDAPLF
jgi:hypothetical protein